MGLLRTGASNFLASGLKRQDNDLIVIESTEAARVFTRAFEARYASGELATCAETVSISLTYFATRDRSHRRFF